MSDATAILYCPNLTCQTPNPESGKFCQKCRVPLSKRYLWVVGEAGLANQVGSLLGDRYLVKYQQILLDTKPALSLESSLELPETAIPYLRLFPYRLHIPQVYSLLQLKQGLSKTPILLLEHAPIRVENRLAGETDRVSKQLGQEQIEGLQPSLMDAWKKATALRQLNWLWQIAQLWQPLSSEGVATSLLDPKLLRVEGPLVRLLELKSDQGMAPPQLMHLGELWSSWVTTGHPEIADFGELLCQKLIRGQVRTAEQLVAYLDQALEIVGKSQSCQIQIATCTDKGPSRQRNEDACFPLSGTKLTISLDASAKQSSTSEAKGLPLTIVCDGIGGHEGGDIASNLAIQSVQQQLQKLRLNSQPTHPVALVAELERAVLIANDLISQRNDGERRQDRHRMGTTIVMAFGQGHELYTTHVGDSRAYWINRNSCYQVTLDDDLASRDVRLGNTFYRDALQNPGAGSLVQALGMSSSATLHPTTQRFVLDEDCVFLLCSDGLSDHDRVEDFWELEILPILEGKIDVALGSQRLVALANAWNGHDNVTVSLLHCKVVGSNKITGLTELLQADLKTSTNLPSPAASASTLKTQIPQNSRSTADSRRSPASDSLSRPFDWYRNLGFLVGVVSLLGVGSLLVYWFLVEDPRLTSPQANSSPNSAPTPEPTQPSPELVPAPSPLATPVLAPGLLIQVGNLTPNSNQTIPQPRFIPAFSQPGTSGSQPSSTPGVTSSNYFGGKLIPAGTVVRILKKQEIPGQGYWLNLRVCLLPNVNQAAEALPLLKPGEIGWVQAATVMPLITQPLLVQTTQLNQCAQPSVAPTTAPRPAPAQAVE